MIGLRYSPAFVAGSIEPGAEISCNFQATSRRLFLNGICWWIWKGRCDWGSAPNIQNNLLGTKPRPPK